MSDKDREAWILNDESLYLWWKDTGLGMRAFIHANRDEISKTINNQLAHAHPRDWTYRPRPSYRLTS